MMQSQNNILTAAEEHVTNIFKEKISAEYVYHDIQHTKNVVEATSEIGGRYGLTNKELETLHLAAWFHDIGYDQGPEGHEERSCRYARDFLASQSYPNEDIESVLDCIMATKVPHSPDNLLEEVLCDADLSHLGKKVYWDRCGRVRQELLMTKSILMSEQEWVDFELDFITNHSFHTAIAQELYDSRKEKHVKQLKKQKIRLNPKAVESVEDLAIRDKKKKKKQKKTKKAVYSDDMEINQLRLGRGVETMYRTTYRTHINLSSIADNKANIMLSINAIIISIILTTLVPNFADNKQLILPTVVLLTVCLLAMVFAILSTRPKITEGKFNREDIEKRSSNLLFFGNYYNMKLEDFHWGMMEMIKDNDFLYSSMTRDLYYLGVVLAKKYRYLSICYNVFMYGLITAVLVFAIAFMFEGTTT